jgi:hypothetical protein
MIKTRRTDPAAVLSADAAADAVAGGVVTGDGAEPARCDDAPHAAVAAAASRTSTTRLAEPGRA